MLCFEPRPHLSPGLVLFPHGFAKVRCEHPPSEPKLGTNAFSAKGSQSYESYRSESHQRASSRKFKQFALPLESLLYLCVHPQAAAQAALLASSRREKL